MPISVNPRGLTFFVASDATVSPVTDFNSDRSVEPVQSIDKATGLPLWSFKAELGQDGNYEAVKIKWASKSAPVIYARTEHVLSEDSYLLATPYIVEGAGKPKQGISWKGVGELKINTPVRPVTPVVPTSKD